MMMHGKNAYNIPAQTLQQVFPNTARVPVWLNHSFINFLGGTGTSFSDHSSSFSINNDDVSALGSNYGTPQGRQQQPNLQHQNFLLHQNNKIMVLEFLDQFISYLGCIIYYSTSKLFSKQFKPRDVFATKNVKYSRKQL